MAPKRAVACYGGAWPALDSASLCEDCQGNPQNWVSVFVDDVDRLHEEYLRSGAKILVPPTDHEWGMREMLVEDRDGHRLRMGHGTGDED